MKKNILIWAVVFLAVFTLAKAEYAVFDNVEDFEKSKWAVCEAATDGCNNFFMKDWKVAWWTRKMCAPDFKAKWTCTKFKEGMVTTMMIPVTTSAPVACTMEYMPVCWVDWKTYWNRCWAEKWAWVEIDYKWECKEKWVLSENDENFYNSIKKDLKPWYVKIVDKFLSNYLERMESKEPKEDKVSLNEKMINWLEKRISNLLMQFPQDIALPEFANNKYLTYTLLKFELMKLDFFDQNISWSKMIEIVKNNEVEWIFQAHDLTVEVKLKNWVTYVTKEKKIDDFINLKVICWEKCKDVTLATE